MKRILKTQGWGVLRKEVNAISLVGVSAGRVFLCTFTVSHPCDTGSVAQSHPCFWRPPTVRQSWLVFPYKHFRTGPVLHQQTAKAGHLHKSHILNQASLEDAG